MKKILEYPPPPPPPLGDYTKGVTFGAGGHGFKSWPDHTKGVKIGAAPNKGTTILN